MTIYRKPKEAPLPNDYPVYAGYLYVADGEVVRARGQETVIELKQSLGVKELTNCDIAARGLWDQVV